VDRRGPGDTIAIQERWRGRLWAARPATVVQDEDDLLVLWCPGGARWKVASTPPGRDAPEGRTAWYADLLTGGDWILVDDVWRTPTLWLLRPSDWYAVWVAVLGSPDGWCWYVNLQEPFVRTAAGIRATDLMLDVVVDADRRWRLKDESDFEALGTHGLLDAAGSARVRSEAARAIEAVERGAWPFDGSWLDWRPDPAWPAPELPPSWDELEE
jgi:Protein of unknown function (DUF402)